MKEDFKAPKEVDMANPPVKLKFNLGGSIASLIRIAFDLNTGSVGVGTLAEVAKAVQFENDKQKEAYLLTARSLIDAVREQIKSRISQTDIDDNKNLVYHSKELQFEIFKGLDDNGYSFNCNVLSNPQSFELLRDFKPCYQAWLLDSFPLSEESARALVADFSDYFAYEFHRHLTEKGKEYYSY